MGNTINAEKKTKAKETIVFDDGGLSKTYKLRTLKKKTNFLYKMGKPFTLSKSGNVYELVSSMWKEKAFRSSFSMEDMRFIKSVKKYALDNLVGLRFIDTYYKSSGIEYIKVNKFKAGDVVEDLIYIDINNAYWDTAYQLGIISDSIYERGLDIDKVARLAALGSLAKTKDVWKYDGKKVVKEETIRSWETENLWFAICKRISDVMLDITKAIGDDFVFYWVDGIYIKNNSVSFRKILEIFISQGYTSKFEKIPKITFSEREFVVQGMLEKDKKHYSWSVEKTKTDTPITDYIEKRRLLKKAQDLMYRVDKEEKEKRKRKKELAKKRDKQVVQLMPVPNLEEEAAIKDLLAMSMGNVE